MRREEAIYEGNFEIDPSSEETIENIYNKVSDFFAQSFDLNSPNNDRKHLHSFARLHGTSDYTIWDDYKYHRDKTAKAL